MGDAWTDKAAYDLVIRDSVIRGDGPVWLNRAGHAFGIVFSDCRLKHNAGNASGDLAQPVGMFHVEGGSLQVEIRGGYCWDNNGYLFTTGPNSAEGSRLVISGASKIGGIKGNIHAPNAYLTVLDVSVLEEGATINVKSGVGLSPRSGELVEFGPSDRAAKLDTGKDAEDEDDDQPLEE